MDFCQTSEVLRSAIGLAKAPFRATDGVVVKAAARRAHDKYASFRWHDAIWLHWIKTCDNKRDLGFVLPRNANHPRCCNDGFRCLYSRSEGAPPNDAFASLSMT